MRAVIIAGHGSLRRDSGAAMIRLAARAREASLAPLVVAGFLNYSRPTLAEALARCAAQGAGEVVVAPYLLVPGYFARVALPRALAALRPKFPALSLAPADCLGDHPALAELVLKRADQARGVRREAPEPGRDVADQRLHATDDELPPHASALSTQHSALLLMAHGSPDASANAPIEAVAERVRATGRFADVRVAFLDLNEPAIPDALDDMASRGGLVVALPYFLQLGGHVAEDLPALIAQARLRHPHVAIALASHLGYDPLLAQVIADRAREAFSRSSA
jgi:sirohydrochlorin cobaltochelatase